MSRDHAWHDGKKRLGLHFIARVLLEGNGNLPAYWYVTAFVQCFIPDQLTVRLFVGRSFVGSFVFSCLRFSVSSSLPFFVCSVFTLSCIFYIVWLRLLCRTDLFNNFAQGTTAESIDGIPNQEHRSHTGSENKSSHRLIKFKKNSTPVAEDRLDDVSFLLMALTKYQLRYFLPVKYVRVRESI